jgi:hypothetical protein
VLIRATNIGCNTLCKKKHGKKVILVKRRCWNFGCEEFETKNKNHINLHNNTMRTFTVLFFEFQHRIGNLFDRNNSWTLVNNTTVFLHCKKTTQHYVNHKSEKRNKSQNWLMKIPFFNRQFWI